MTEVFQGERLMPGYIGQFFIILSFVTSILSLYGFLKSSNQRTVDISAKNSFWNLAKVSFYTHFFAIVGVFVTLFYMIFSHYFEYFYVWRHSSMNLPWKYILASFWEGSEGSFLLWMFWQAFLGLFVIAGKNPLSGKVMVVVCIVQAFLATMVLGVYFGDTFHLGSSPFRLLRDDMSDSPELQVFDYMTRLKDGNGLNPLLQNYWMTIHPPVLFFGFATALFPFAYSIAALWQNDFKSFIKPALRWSLTTGAFLGLGIMMGGAWAYESLSFGGYWAWDPVENASLVPWLIIIAGLHTVVVFKSTGRSLKISLIFLILSYVFVWYSTFLTRTGVLGETSVHAFTDSGKALYYHLLVVLFAMLATSIWALAARWKKMPKVVGEEAASSREFWMLVGSVVLLLSSFFIILFTSVPIWGPAWKLIANDEVAITDPIDFYNKQQLWFAVVIALLSGAIQFFKYKKSNAGKVMKVVGLLAAISILLTILLVYAQDVKGFALVGFSFAAIFSIVANVFYIVSNQKMQLRKSGGAITHLAFGLMLLAILFSSYKKDIISINRTGKVMDFAKETYQENLKESRENVLLFRNTAYPMGEYMVTYLGDSAVDNDPPLNYYKLRFEKRNPETNDLEESFFLYPNVFLKDGKVSEGANPDYRNYLTKDIFTYISYMSDPTTKDKEADFRQYVLKKNDSVFLANGFLVFEGLQSNANEGASGPIEAEGVLTAYDINGTLGTLRPKYIIDGTAISATNDSLNSFGVVANIAKIDPKTGSVEFNIHQKGQLDDYIVIKVTVFPYIGLLWFSIVLMFIGFIMSLIYRRK